jgi:hypothetical protein
MGQKESSSNSRESAQRTLATIQTWTKRCKTAIGLPSQASACTTSNSRNRGSGGTVMQGGQFGSRFSDRY